MNDSEDGSPKCKAEETDDSGGECGSKTKESERFEHTVFMFRKVSLLTWS